MTTHFRIQRLNGDGVYADFVPSGVAPVQVSGDVVAQDASTGGSVAVPTIAVTVSGVVQAQVSTTSGNILVETVVGNVTVSGAVQAQEATTTGAVNIYAEVEVFGTSQAQPATTTGRITDPNAAQDIRIKTPSGLWVKLEITGGTIAALEARITALEGLH